MIPSFGRWVRSLCLIELLATVLVAGSVAHAQQPNTWSRVANFGGSIGCGFFFDEARGLVGSGVRWSGQYASPHCAIYQTTDGGTTWTASQVPALIGGAVTSIWMQDTLTGYASILPSVDYSIQLTFGSTSLWKTTDGGTTWFDPFHLDHAMSCVYAQNGLLIFTAWDNSESYNNFSIVPANAPGGQYSNDGGQSWTGNFRCGNGIAFSDNLNGVL